VLRTAVALSAACQKPIRIFNIRARRPKPGIRPQHLRAVGAVAKLCRARVHGLQLDSRELVFEPGEVSAGRFKIDIGTAGSTTLVLQALLPAAAFAPQPLEFEITGGTDNPLAPPVDYMKNVTLRALGFMGYSVELECLRRGHYPRGGGLVRARIKPAAKLSPLKLTEGGAVRTIEGIAHCVQLPSHVAKRMAHAASRTLISAGYSEVHIKTETYDPFRDPHLGPGGGITLWAELESGAVIGASALAKRGKPAEEVGRDAAKTLVRQLQRNAAVDRYLTDQLVPYLALAEGTSEIKSAELTLHALTNIALVERIVGVKFSLKGEVGESGIIRVAGIGRSGRGG
jgi:RNA 3'-phosphate cyclase